MQTLIRREFETLFIVFPSPIYVVAITSDLQSFDPVLDPNRILFLNLQLTTCS
jgi:hypothetical protein